MFALLNLRSGTNIYRPISYELHTSNSINVNSKHITDFIQGLIQIIIRAYYLRFSKPTNV